MFKVKDRGEKVAIMVATEEHLKLIIDALKDYKEKKDCDSKSKERCSSILNKLHPTTSTTNVRTSNNG